METRRAVAALRLSTQGRLWITAHSGGDDPVGLSAWAQRAAALAHYGCSGWFASAPMAPSWRPDPWRGVPDAAPITASPGFAADCPVCFASYDDLLPSPSDESRSMPGTWQCLHAVCRECRRTIAATPSAARQRCPLCRVAPASDTLRFAPDVTPQL